MNKAVYKLMSVILLFALTFGSYSSAGASSVSASQMAATTSYGKDTNAGMPALQTSATRMLIPLYIFPSVSAWAPVVSANVYRNIDVVINPANGVGTSKSTSYANGVNQLRAGNLGIYGYVYSSYGARSLTTIKAEIDNWQLWYGVDGIFFDEASNSSTQIPYYTDLWNYVTSKGMKVILNPGTSPVESYAAISNSIVIYENTSSVALSVPSWAVNYPTSKFSALQYGATVDQMRTFVSSAKARNVGYVFVTSDIAPNPWNELPSYLAEEAALLANGVILPTSTPALTNTPIVPPTPTATFLPATPTPTSVTSGSTIKFAVIGDFGTNNADELAVANMVKSWNPDFIITTGDNNYESGAATTIDANIGKYYQEFIGNYKGAYGAGSAVNRFFPSLGNHDHVATNAQPSIDYFTLPGNEYYYDFVRGNVHFFALDHYTLGGTSQTGETALWLKAGLAASTSQFNVVYFHAAPYTSGTGNGSYTPMRWPFAAWGADVVMAGHEHSYERLSIDGITYFVNGAGGRALYAMGSPIAGSQVRYNANQGAQLVTVGNDTFNSKFYNKLGVLIDDYTTTSGSTNPPALTNTPTSISSVPTLTQAPINTSTPTPTIPVTINSPTATLAPATPVIVPAGQNTVEVRVANGTDDVEESSTGSIYINSSDLELVYDTNDQIVGIRFAGVNVPKGATITNAYLQFQADEASSGVTTLSIQGEASSNALAFANTVRNVSSRLKTTKAVGWSPSPWLTLGAMGSDQRTPNLAPVVQEIVSQSGWVAGNSMVMMITGSGVRVAEAYEIDPAGAPLLHIDYTMAAGQNNTPTLPATTVPTGSPVAVSATPTVPILATPTVPVTINSPTATLVPAISTTVPATSVPAGQNTVEVRVVKGTDDVEESLTGTMYLNSSDLELVYDTSNQVVGIRFVGVNIPKGATITNAYLQFKVDETSSSVATTVSIRGEASANALAFAITARNISSRSKTTKAVGWSPSPWLTLGAMGTGQRTPNLAPVVQEIVSQSGWVSGNSMVMIITGSGKRVAEAYEKNPAGAPLLHIEYTMAAGLNNTPILTATTVPTGSPTASPTNTATIISPTSTPLPPTPTTSVTDTPSPTVPAPSAVPTETPTAILPTP